MTIQFVEIFIYSVIGVPICCFKGIIRDGYEVDCSPDHVKLPVAMPHQLTKIENSHHNINADWIKIALGHPKFIPDHIKITADHAKIISDYDKIIFDHAGIIFDRDKITADHAGIIFDRDKITADHAKMTFDHAKIIPDHNKITADHRKITYIGSGARPTRPAKTFFSFFLTKL